MGKLGGGKSFGVYEEPQRPRVQRGPLTLIVVQAKQRRAEQRECQNMQAPHVHAPVVRDARSDAGLARLLSRRRRLESARVQVW